MTWSIVCEFRTQLFVDNWYVLIIAETDYNTATELVVTFVLENSAEASNWITEFTRFMNSYDNANMTITYVGQVRGIFMIVFFSLNE